MRAPASAARPSTTNTPQGSRTISMPRALHRPLSAAAPARPGSVLRTPQRLPDAMVFDEAPRTDEPDRRRGLLHQLDLGRKSTDDYAKITALQAQVDAADAARSQLQGEKDALAKELADVKHASRTHDKSMASVWDDERAELALRIEELQGAGRETIAVFEHQLDLAAAEQHTLRTQVQELDAQLADTHRAREDTAAQIDLASMHEQLAHLQAKLDAHEDELAEVREANEQLRKDAQDAAAEHERTLAEHVAALAKAHAHAEEQADAVRRAEKEIARLQQALDAEKTTLENEREDMEQLRTAPTDSDLERRIAALQTERTQLEDAHAKEIVELEALVESRIFREEELENTMEQLRAERDEARAALANK